MTNEKKTAKEMVEEVMASQEALIKSTTSAVHGIQSGISEVLVDLFEDGDHNTAEIAIDMLRDFEDFINKYCKILAENHKNSAIGEGLSELLDKIKKEIESDDEDED